MMENEDGHGYNYNTFQYYNQQLLLHQNHQQDMLLMQPPLFTSLSALDHTYKNPNLLIPPPLSYSYGCSYSEDQYDDMGSNLSDDQETLFASSLMNGRPGTSSLLRNMLNHEFEKMNSTNMMEDKALAASRSHSEAERRRRERINSHLTTLRTLLPNTTKTDKASLLAEVIQRVKELKQQTSVLPELNTVPTDSDELTFETCTGQDGQLLIKASLCCDDRSNVLQDLIKTCQALNLRTVKADITTLTGRIKYVVFIAGEPDQASSETFVGDKDWPFIKTVQEAFRSVMGRSFKKLDEKNQFSDSSLKRRRVKDAI